MAHGYMREFDEGWGDERDRQRDVRGEDGLRNEQKTNFMIGERDRGLEHDRNRAGGFFGNITNQGRERGASGGHGAREGASSDFRSHQDDHYLSWRAKQIEALDRDYADYCREREQQFHEDFDNWRLSRRPTDEGEDELLLTTPRSTTGTEASSEGSVRSKVALDPENAATPGATGEKSGAR